MYFLGENPEWIQRVKEEFESFGGKIDQNTLKKALVTEAVVKETLRLAHIVAEVCIIPNEILIIDSLIS